MVTVSQLLLWLHASSLRSLLELCHLWRRNWKKGWDGTPFPSLSLLHTLTPSPIPTPPQVCLKSWPKSLSKEE